MFHTRIPSLAWAGLLIVSGVGGAMAQAPTVQRQTPTQANKVVGSSPASATLPAPGGAATAATNKPGGAASQPAPGGPGAPAGLAGGGSKVDASAAGARIGGLGGATQAQGSTPGAAALPANKFQQAADGRAAAGPDAGKPVTPADLSREAQLRKLADPQGGLSTAPSSGAAAAVGGKPAAEVVQGAGATPQPGTGKNPVSRQEQQSIEANDTTKTGAQRALPQGLSGQTIESVVGGAYRSLEKAAIESGVSKKYNEGRPSTQLACVASPT
jgi:hypothetical protein